jgi:type II secretory pathway component PulF
MPLFRCIVTDANGRKKEFIKEAASEDVLALELIQKNNYPISLKVVKPESGEEVAIKKFSAKVVLDFTETMSMLLTSGLSLKDALQIIRTIFMKGPINRLCNSLDDQIKKGDSFHTALTRFKGSFPPLYIGLVKIGQKIGSLDNILKKLAEYLEQNKKFKSKLNSALAYPLTILGAAIGLMVLMLTFIFPKIKGIFSSLNADVSADINNAFAAANVILGGALVLVGVLVVAGITINMIRKSESELAEALDGFMLRIPFAGKVLFTQEALNFLFAMETLTASGFSVEDALSEAANVLKNRALKSSIVRIKEKIIKGIHLSNAFLQEKLFAERIGRWISIGERSGNIEIVFAQLRNYYQDDIDKWTARIMNIIEPALLILAGLVVLVMLLVFFVPIFSIYQAY